MKQKINSCFILLFRQIHSRKIRNIPIASTLEKAAKFALKNFNSKLNPIVAFKFSDVIISVKSIQYPLFSLNLIRLLQADN